MKQKNYVGLLLDNSGSMYSVRHSVIKDFNEQLQAIQDRSKELDTKVTFVTFNHDVNFMVVNGDPLEIKELNDKSYSARGGTALRDAIHATIDEIKKYAGENDPVLITIVSDGIDLNSTHNQQETSELIQMMQDKYKWTFTYVGCDHDVSKVASDLNIPNSFSFSKDEKGFKRSSNIKKCAYHAYTSKVTNATSDSRDLSIEYFTLDDSSAGSPSPLDVVITSDTGNVNS